MYISHIYLIPHVCFTLISLFSYFTVVPPSLFSKISVTLRLIISQLWLLIHVSECWVEIWKKTSLITVLCDSHVPPQVKCGKQTLSLSDLLSSKLYYIFTYMQTNITRWGLLQRLINLTKYKQHRECGAWYSLSFVIVLAGTAAP